VYRSKLFHAGLLRSAARPKLHIADCDAKGHSGRSSKPWTQFLSSTLALGRANMRGLRPRSRRRLPGSCGGRASAGLVTPRLGRISSARWCVLHRYYSMIIIITTCYCNKGKQCTHGDYAAFYSSSFPT
jgi:hypothetical protein